MTITTKHEVGAKVWIKDLKITGHVLAVYICEHGIQYRVRWMTTTGASTEYLFEDEVEQIVPSESVGFKPKPPTS